MDALDYWLVSIASSGLFGRLLSVRNVFWSSARWFRVLTAAAALLVAVLVFLAFVRYQTEAAGLMLLTCIATIGLGSRRPWSGKLF